MPKIRCLTHAVTGWADAARSFGRRLRGRLRGWVGCSDRCGQSGAAPGRAGAVVGCRRRLSGRTRFVAVSGAPRGGCSDEQRQVVDAFERGDEVGGPGPVVGEFAVALPAGVHDSAGGVQKAVAEPFGFGFGQVCVEGEVAGPGEQVVAHMVIRSPAVLAASECDGNLANQGALWSLIWRSARSRPRWSASM